MLSVSLWIVRIVSKRDIIAGSKRYFSVHKTLLNRGGPPGPPGGDDEDPWKQLSKWQRELEKDKDTLAERTTKTILAERPDHEETGLDFANVPDIEQYTETHIVDVKKHLKNPLLKKYLVSGPRRPRHPVRQDGTRFRDVFRVKLKSGDGGNGFVSFLRAKGMPKGPPDGGDGGDGGNVYVQAVEGLSSLHKLRPQYVADNGVRGMSKQMFGAAGRDLVLQVPVGTYITVDPEVSLHRENAKFGEGWIHSSGFEEYNEEREFFQELKQKKYGTDRKQDQIERMEDAFPEDGIDLYKTGPPVLLLKGGKGGSGNMRFHSTNIWNPRFATVGRGGLQGVFNFELKLLADLGLVGFPNAGKSTLLRAISNAKPRIGHWEFTTLKPYVGTIMLDPSEVDDYFTVADIPGIISGANLDKGMGIEFLRHIERSKGLIFVVGLDSKDPAADLRILMNELGPARLDGKEKLVVATKADLPNTEQIYQELEQFTDNLGWPALPISAIQKGADVEILLRAMAGMAGVLKK
ncbi:P-loop containing nucleoside triphosphate hydrolase protein [Lipomyces oligophaga]|uniref:P-loop containing nucleoside triphosphate hydrolase protein n=1 Tax=Lipomyces oligophaga TaxID=45792 RepID=UPI0034CD353E